MRLLPLLCITTLIPLGCAYRLGLGDRSLPQGYQKVAVPLFKNATFETGIEVDFTNSMIREIERSGIAKVVEKENAEVILLGTIQKVNVGRSAVTTDSKAERSIYGVYTLMVTTLVELVRRSDRRRIWAAEIKSERPYNASRIFLPRLNTANPLYNLSARREAFKFIALDSSTKAFDRLTENF